MADLVIHNIDPALEARLRDRATEKGRSAEDEAVALLSALLTPEPVEERPARTREDGKDWVEGVVALFKGIGLKPGEELPRPEYAPWSPPDFSKW